MLILVVSLRKAKEAGLKYKYTFANETIDTYVIRSVRTKNFMMKQLFALLITVFCLSGCLKDNTYTPTTTEVIYHQTFCSDPWGRADTDNNTLLDLSNFLSAQQIKVYSIRIDSIETAQTCLACTCTTGKIITITAPLDQRSSLLKIGFN